MYFIILSLTIFIIFIIIYLFNTNIFEGLKENNSLPSSNKLNYDISNINQEYHPTFIDTNDKSYTGFSLPIFYKPKSYVYSDKTYVPNYVDTIYMSSLTGLSDVAQYH